MANRIAGIMGFLGVSLGAFGAHGLKDLLAANATAAIWEKAVLYHLIHAVVLFIIAGRQPFRQGPFLAFLLGMLVFSGSLYVLAVTNIRWLGAITPIGGVSFLVGWAWLSVGPRQPSAVDSAHGRN
jgi:uncharacterized membrane protein YgdD (TMEM256/DUF423 family)